VGAYLSLTKPRISLLFAITGLAVLLMDSHVMSDPVRLWLIVLAIFMTGGSANAFNQYFERDRDKLMARTAKKRPLPQGKISPDQALIFSISLGIAGTALLWYFGNPLASIFGLGTIVFYSFYYTLYLKPRTPYNIVIGGIAGAMGPLIAYAALTGRVAWVPFIMFLIIFFWTPPHFWALALCCKDDYSKVGLPMLPVVMGDEVTRKQILYYSFTLLPLSLSLFFLKAFGLVYLITALILGILFIGGAYRIYRQKTIKVCWQFFAYSILYLLLLFGAMMVDTLI
jgi:protoheme IX farnesyltransferase